jgi:hypothetical protein
MIFPKEFETMKIYTKYATTGTFDRQEYDVVIFTFPRPEKIRKEIPPNRTLPKELASYYDTMRIICIPADKYYTITKWDF